MGNGYGPFSRTFCRQTPGAPGPMPSRTWTFPISPVGHYRQFFWFCGWFLGDFSYTCSNPNCCFCIHCRKGKIESEMPAAWAPENNHLLKIQQFPIIQIVFPLQFYFSCFTTFLAQGFSIKTKQNYIYNYATNFGIYEVILVSILCNFTGVSSSFNIKNLSLNSVLTCIMVYIVLFFFSLLLIIFRK